MDLKTDESVRPEVGVEGLSGAPRRATMVCLLLVLVIAAVYFNSLDNEFTNWDDGMIFQNSTIRNLDWDTLRKIFTYERGCTYQPVRVLSYAVDYYFWGLNPLGYHITNTLFYALTCVMVFLTLERLSSLLRIGAEAGSHFRVGLFGALLFAVHPVHVEAVAWLSARKEVLQGFFFFLAFFLYLKGRASEGRGGIVFFSFVLVSFLLAVLSKPSAVVLPAVLVVYEIAVARGSSWGFIKRHGLFFLLSGLISLVFVSILLKVMVDAGGIKPYRGGTLFSNLIISLHAFVYNLKLLALTINYSAAYTIPITNPLLSLRAFVFFGLTLLLLGLSLWSLRRTGVLFFSFFFFLVTVSPYVNLIPISTLLADRYVFIASFSYALLLGCLFDRLYTYRHPRCSRDFFKLLSVGCCLFLTTAYGLMTVRQNEIWENSFTLWADAVEKHPGSNTANAMMGVVCMEVRMDQKAVEYLEQAVRILPYDYQSRNNLGIVYGRLGHPDRALKEYQTALWLKPDDDSIRLNLASLCQEQKEFAKAEEILQAILVKNPRDAYVHYRLGLVYKDAGKDEAAISELKTSLDLAPQIINPYEELGNIYLKLNDPAKAKFYFTQGIKAVPRAKRTEMLRWMVQDLESGD